MPVPARGPFESLASESSGLPAAPDDVTRPRRLARTSRGPGLSDEILPSLSRLSLGTRWALVAVVWAVAVASSTVVRVDSWIFELAVMAHVLSLVTAFGAVVMVDWHGLLWLRGRRSLRESSRVAAAASPLIWVGIGGLLLSGVLLHPDLGSRLTQAKLALVLVVALNGAALSNVRRALAGRPLDETPASLPAALRRGVVLFGVVSQAGWWAIIAIGFLTSVQRV